jgi:predicted nucleotidyltransferase
MLPSERVHVHREKILEIMERYPMISNLRLVGSVARGEDTEGSDIDFFVDTAPGATYFDIGGLYNDFEALLGISCNIIISGDHLHEYMRTTIERDAKAI